MQRRLLGCLLLFMVLLGCSEKHSLSPTLSRNREREPETTSLASPLPVAGEGLGERAAPARRIVSLAPGLTELIYAVGAEQWLLATVEYSDYPEPARKIPRIGDAFRVDMEKLLALHPDLVLVWTTGTPGATVEQIKALGLRVESIEVQHLSEVGASLLRVGELTGMQARAQQAAQQFEQGIANLRARYAGSPMLRTFIEVNQQPLYTVNGKHVLSEVVNLCGGENVFADLSQLAPAIGVEAVLKADPDVILSTEGTAGQIRQDWQVWRQLKAVKQAHIYAVSPDTTTRATPRLLQGAQAICNALEQARSK